MRGRTGLVFLLLFFAAGYSGAQIFDKAKSYQVAAIGFWNVENLYDTLNDRWKNDEDFTPQGANAWNAERYRAKIAHLGEALSQMATDATPDGLALFGLCEVENKAVVQDLVSSAPLKSRHYRVVHLEGPDMRGIDPALAYNPDYFKLSRSLAYRIKLPDSTHRTRHILVVSGSFLGEPLTVLVNHWPSRRGGEKASRPGRMAAAAVAKHIADSVALRDPQARIIVMGDLNDDPVDESVKNGLGTYADPDQPEQGKFFNPMEPLYRQGIGSLAYKDSWNLFDQILLNRPWLPRNYTAWQYHSVRVFNMPFLKNASGRQKGYPFRTYAGSQYQGGYSDHLPVYILVAKEKK